jgi:methylmalonyl-CoA mutase C-terminal domain/subunit
VTETHDPAPGGVAGAKKHRILVAKPGLDGHDRGAKVVAASLRDAGFEVIYLGLQQTPEMIADAAAQEDVEAVGLSILSGAHMTLFPRVQKCLRDRGLSRVLLFGGGIVPPEEATALARRGVGRIFGPGTDTREIASYLQEALEGPPRAGGIAGAGRAKGAAGRSGGARSAGRAGAAARSGRERDRARRSTAPRKAGRR